MHIHILGVCGTFMGGIAQIAITLGHKVTGSDQHVYPPMSDQLQAIGIELQEGYLTEHLQPRPDMVIVGNTISRGNPALEYVLENKLVFCSGPEWLYREVLINKHVLAVSGTHGKTTTTTILSWILEYAGKNPGFLIGGVAENFGLSARLTESEYFVIEADEYDTSFSDKRSKFIHYHPGTLIINNLEFDHADIFTDLDAIKREFHHMIRVLPGSTQIIYPDEDDAVQSVIEMGCWSDKKTFGEETSDWRLQQINNDFTEFVVTYQDQNMATIKWTLLGKHNAKNALAAIIAANHIGIPVDVTANALAEFKSVKRRLECLYQENGTALYDDFAHHPTAIHSTLAALRSHVNEKRIIAIMEPRSNTMKMGVHSKTLASSFKEADMIILFQPDTIDWNLKDSMHELGEKCQVFIDIDAIVTAVKGIVQQGDQIVVMSNGGFGGIHKKLIDVLKEK
ncbi:MAG: UDP-N-acetylmuramate:L-alanyl-gamma-D-glutamyl-meso-diaminopimelate ligase [Pseudomonadota bacterium]